MKIDMERLHSILFDEKNDETNSDRHYSGFKNDTVLCLEVEDDIDDEDDIESLLGIYKDEIRQMVRSKNAK